jgi:hypothetical protein
LFALSLATSIRKNLSGLIRARYWTLGQYPRTRYRAKVANRSTASLDVESCGTSQKEWVAMMSLAVFVTLLFFYCLISQRLERTVVTAPIVFTVAGMLMFPALPGLLKAGVNAEVLFRLLKPDWSFSSDYVA